MKILPLCALIVMCIVLIFILDTNPYKITKTICYVVGGFVARFVWDWLVH